MRKASLAFGRSTRYFLALGMTDLSFHQADPGIEASVKPRDGAFLTMTTRRCGRGEARAGGASWVPGAAAVIRSASRSVLRRWRGFTAQTGGTRGSRLLLRALRLHA